MFETSVHKFLYRWIAILLVFAFALGSAGVQTTYAASSGTVIGWGFDDEGQTNIPDGLSDVIAVAAGYQNSLALKSDGTVVAWGWNALGQSTIPDGLSDVVAIAAGESHSLALKSDGTVVAWGCVRFGSAQCTIPDGLSDVIAISAGYAHSLALKSDGTVVAWGDNSEGKTTIPEGLSDVIAIAAGWRNSVALKSDGTVVVWGYNYYPVPEGLSDVIAIAAGEEDILALKSDGTVVTWGWNAPNMPDGLSDVTAIAAGGYDMLALKSDGTVVDWGWNADFMPDGLSGVTAIAAGGVHGLAVVSSAPSDVTSPGITITTPAENAVFTLGQVVNAEYACQDEVDGSGVASCVGTAANGSPIDTSSVGAKFFSVNATDNAGNPASLTHNYSVVYNFSGFLQPVDNLPTLNLVKGGAGVAVKFGLGGNQGLSIFAAGYPISQQIACASGVLVDDIEQTVTTGSSSISYNAATETYAYTWKTDKAWAGTCRQLIVKLSDGTEHKANFKLK